MNKANTQLLATALFVIALAGMTSAGAIDASLKPATDSVCKNMKDLQASTFVGVIAIIMTFAGGLMIWFKARGGLAMVAFGVIGYFFIKNLTGIASSLGLKACG